MKISKVIIVVNEAKDHARVTAAALRSLLEKRGVEQEWLETLPPDNRLLRSIRDCRDKKADMVIACGGDGTLLQTAHRFRGTHIPILGINIGYLGFITSLQGDRVRKEMDRILNYEFVVSERMALDLTVSSGTKQTAGWRSTTRQSHAGPTRT